ncbi:hypothetical protein CPT_MarsHill_201 [Staphylococcus phage MarsHill]|nr:hypothetical protein CPT_MarsHill_201 [Staphylococcus phage MarsHill]
MSYRMFIKPLTEKTGAKPERHEVMVNTETGMISLINSDGENVSGLKDITVDISLKKEILSFLDIVNKDVVESINDIKPKYENEMKRTDTIKAQLDKLKNLNKDIISQIKQIENNNVTAYVMLQELIKQIYNIIDVYSKTYLDIAKVERKVDHLIYLRDILRKNRIQMEKDIKSLTTKNNEVKKLLATKEYKSTYDAWVADYVKRTKDLSKESKVSSISFSHKI